MRIIHVHDTVVRPCWAIDSHPPIEPIEERDEIDINQRGKAPVQHPVIRCFGLDDDDCQLVRNEAWAIYGRDVRWHLEYARQVCAERE